MADYYAVLKKAISALPNPSGEQRRAVYDKARAALKKQLESFDPPIAPSEITRQRLALEDCIRKVEAEAAKGTLQQLMRTAEPARPAAPPVAPPPSAPAVPPAPPPPVAAPPVTAPPIATAPVVAPPVAPTPRPPVAPPAPVAEAPRAPAPAPSLSPADFPPLKAPTPSNDILGSTMRSAEGLGGAAQETARQAREALGLGRVADPEIPVERPEPRLPEPAPTSRPLDVEPAFPRLDEDEPRSGRGALVAAVVVVLLIAAGAFAVFSQRDAIRGLFGGSQTAETPRPAGGGNGTSQPKNTDRLLSEDTPAQPGQTPPPAPATPGVRQVQTQPINPQAPAATPPAATPAPAPAPAPAPTPAPPPAAQAPAPAAPAAPVVGQRAILYEETNVGSNQGTVVNGQVAWSVVREPPEPGAAPETMLRARAEVAERGIVAVVTIRPNRDSALPASHLIEIRFTLKDNAAGRGVQNVPGMIMKPSESARGDPLIGAAARISGGFFWIALASGQVDRERNLTLIRERGWIDLPLLYENGRRAILTLEKGPGGERAVNDAIAAWGP